MKTKNYKKIGEILSELKVSKNNFSKLGEARKELSRLQKSTKDEDEKDYLNDAIDALENLEESFSLAIDSLENIEEDD